MKQIISVFIVIVMLALVFAIGSQNEAFVTVNFLIAQSQLRLSSLIAICVLIGIAIGIAIMVVSWLAMRVKVATLRAKVRRLTKVN